MIVFRSIPRLALTLLFCSILATSPALANDYEAAIGIGGLELKKSERIAIMLEDLYVSETLIKIRYEFKNESANDISTIVAFPIPPVDVDEASNSGLFKFSTLVNGHAVTTKVEKKTVAGKDQDDQDVEKTQFTYFWRQTFPARTVITIEHSYKPITGRSIGFRSGQPLYIDQYQKTYCIEDNLIRSPIKTIGGNSKQEAVWHDVLITYILTTGASWSGPIREFRLVVDKGSPKNLVSFCGENVKQISQTQFEMRKNNFLPQKNLDVLILLRDNEE
jgi:hypothetical protein